MYSSDETRDIENDSEIYVLTYEEVEPFIPPDPENVDEGVRDYIRQNKRNMVKRRVARVNSLYDEFSLFWPQGTPILFYFALEMCKDVEIEVLERLQDPVFIRSVIERFETLKKGSSPEKIVSEKPSILNDDDFESTDDESDENFQTPTEKTKSHHFTQEETKKFIGIISGLTKPTSWKDISKAMHGKQQKECKALYKRLNEEGVLESSFVTANFTKTEPAEDLSQFSHIKSLFFVCGDQRSVVGPQNMKMKEYAMSNPLFNYIDMLTQEPMIVPALSPDGYVLDYSTWTRLLKDKDHNTNPFTRNIVNRRQLIILTTENIDQYRHMIINLEEMTPPSLKNDNEK
ncbi:hypothetical protein TRFO_22291 [Tritrichomonas foetus]|uniref:U-box domain-containing protein n=1 Tax=Tritrichomonas foetus TaxID=1144522 RepID=A0A1J4KH30_9EUKA|nr:hypothetical protein TRFO_22291 [Tritrichomonas foetus]|eukprot:OHT08958.1 hypothetical protein TRFO_22291 [Tritrichomonas foetus]